MKRKGLCLLIAMALGGTALGVQAHGTDVGAAPVQDSQMSTSNSSSDNPWPDGYDDRWYIAPTLGGYYNDGDRNTNSRQFYYGISAGWFPSEHTSIDFFADRTRRERDSVGNWANNNYGVDARFYAGERGQWRPYALAGLMASRHINATSHGWEAAAELGGGVAKALTENVDFRVEAAYRYDRDDETQPQEDGYGDWRLGISLVSRIGSVPEPVAKPQPKPQPSCEDLDDDSDGVNNCNDQCPNTAAGTMVGPDGCVQKVVIDLRGVNFKFDRPDKGETGIADTLKEPTDQSMEVLNQAVDTLERYPQVDLTVAGYTDSIGTDSYNQDLSERRAQIVYDYLTSHGIKSSRLHGPIGHGENNPVADNDTDAGRQRNRRTELQVDQDSAKVEKKQGNSGM